MKLSPTNKLSIIIITISIVGIFSETNGQQLLFGKQEMKSGYVPIKQTLSYDEVEGSPYFNEKLLDGMVKFNSGDSVLTYLRYNIYKDEIEYLVSGTLLELKNKNDVDYLIVAGERFVYKTYQNGDTKEKGYLQEMVSGKYNVFLKHRVKFQKAEEARSSYHKPVPPKFVQMSDLWFVSVDNGVILKTSLSKSELEELLGDKMKEVEAFKKQNKLKLSKQEDVVKFFEFINGID